uniref:Uncharacterized protein n=1 Tax=Oryza meridionalis TaxID=40149 RepID=A0A0E0CFJ8_9ORYZ
MEETRRQRRRRKRECECQPRDGATATLRSPRRRRSPLRWPPSHRLGFLDSVAASVAVLAVLEVAAISAVPSNSAADACRLLLLVSSPLILDFPGCGFFANTRVNLANDIWDVGSGRCSGCGDDCFFLGWEPPFADLAAADARISFHVCVPEDLWDASSSRNSDRARPIPATFSVMFTFHSYRFMHCSAPNIFLYSRGLADVRTGMGRSGFIYFVASVSYRYCSCLLAVAELEPN